MVYFCSALDRFDLDLVLGHYGMRQAEEPFLDNWFANAAEAQVKAWNKEHGFGDSSPDRQIGKSAVFDISKSSQ